jgi:hypothetical protein
VGGVGRDHLVDAAAGAVAALGHQGQEGVEAAGVEVGPSIRSALPRTWV